MRDYSGLLKLQCKMSKRKAIEGMDCVMLMDFL